MDLLVDCGREESLSRRLRPVGSIRVGQRGRLTGSVSTVAPDALDLRRRLRVGPRRCDQAVRARDQRGDTHRDPRHTSVRGRIPRRRVGFRRAPLHRHRELRFGPLSTPRTSAERSSSVPVSRTRRFPDVADVATTRSASRARLRPARSFTAASFDSARFAIATRGLSRLQVQSGTRSSVSARFRGDAHLDKAHLRLAPTSRTRPSTEWRARRRRHLRRDDHCVRVLTHEPPREVCLAGLGAADDEYAVPLLQRRTADLDLGRSISIRGS